MENYVAMIKVKACEATETKPFAAAEKLLKKTQVKLESGKKKTLKMQVSVTQHGRSDKIEMIAIEI